MSIQSIGALLKERARLTPHKEALVDRGLRLSFSEFSHRVDALSATLTVRGIRKGDRVAIVARNSELHAVAVFAVAQLGAISVVVNWRLTAPEVDHILSDSTPSALIYDTEFAGVLANVSVDLPSVRIHEVTGEDQELPESVDYRSFADLAQPVTAAAIADIAGADPVVIMYTSGTTGRPKGAVLSHTSLISSSQATVCTVDWTYRQRFLLVAPMFHIGGLSHLITNVLRGTTTILMADFKAADAWRLIQDERVTTMMTVPAMLRALLADEGVSEVDRSHLEYMICGGSEVTTELIQEAAAHGIDIQLVYGATEFTGPITFWINESDPDGLGSAGKPIMGCEMTIHDPDTREQLPEGRDGEIWIRGDMLFAGYWKNPTASDEVVIDGWYRTGDIGFIDSNGRLRLRDRLKDMIISGGENIYPSEVENALLTHPLIVEVAVVGQADERWGEIPVAYVVPAAGSPLNEHDVIAHSKAQLASFKAVKDVVFVDELPKNAVGKLLRRQLRTA